jgi:conjugative transfer signal peptidase TraF
MEGQMGEEFSQQGQDKRRAAVRCASGFPLAFRDLGAGTESERSATPHPVCRAAIGISRITLVAIAALTTLCGLGRIFHWIVVPTDSAAAAGIYAMRKIPSPLSLAWGYPAPGERAESEAPQRGDLVVACLPPPIAQWGWARGYLAGGSCSNGIEPVVKKLGALPGDTVGIFPSFVVVNGVRYPNSQTAPLDSHSRPLPHVAWGVRQVRDGEIWLFGFNDWRSWDSRYFGPVPCTDVGGVLAPVVTW